MKNKKILLLIALVVAGYLLFKDSSSNSLTPESLTRVIHDILELENSKNFSQLYDRYYSPEDKAKFNREEIVEQQNELFDRERVVKSTIEIHDVTIEGQYGYIERTRTNCFDKDCDSYKKTREYRQFIFIDGRWYAKGNPGPCIRKTGYDIPEGFKRAVSLIIQRSGGSSMARAFNEIKNCLDIQYAKSDREMEGAEGLFYFQPGQSLKKLNILVSPRYQTKDDLITAVLLVHELVHAYDYVSELQTGEEYSCFEKEARAFNDQNYFLGVLNQEELNSLNARVIYGASDELERIIYAYNSIPRFPGATYLEKAENFVRNNKAYQKQCAGF